METDYLIRMIPHIEHSFDFTDVLLANTRKIWYIMEE